MVGALIVIAYARTGAYVGTLLLPLTVMPVLVTEGLFGAKWVGTGIDALPGFGAAPWPIATLVSMLICAISSVAVYLFMRRMPIGAKISQIR